MDAETKRTCLTKDSAKPHYGYYALPLFTILSAILIVTGTLVAILVWRLAGFIIIEVGLYFIVSYGISTLLFEETKCLDPPKYGARDSEV